MSDLSAAMAACAQAVEDFLETHLPEPQAGDGAARLAEAMRYAALAGGKRLRPFLTVTSAALFDVPMPVAIRIGAAIECAHCYSLVHDDLPAMDDDDLRRGKPSAHRAFDEATAILAGDALQSFAFELIAAPDRARDTLMDTHEDAAIRAELALGLARAIGAAGMAGGQMADLAAETQETAMDRAAIEALQARKTGALIAFSCEAGAVLGGAPAAERKMLAGYGRDLGLAFQLADDLLDLTGDAAETGKAVGKDAAAGKATLPDLLGVEGAQAEAKRLAAAAKRHIEGFGPRAELLVMLADFVVSRRA